LGHGHSSATYRICDQTRKIKKDTDILIEKEKLGKLSEEEIGKFELLLGRKPNMNKKK